MSQAEPTGQANPLLPWCSTSFHPCKDLAKLRKSDSNFEQFFRKPRRPDRFFGNSWRSAGSTPGAKVVRDLSSNLLPAFTVCWRCRFCKRSLLVRRNDASFASAGSCGLLPRPWGAHCNPRPERCVAVDFLCRQPILVGVPVVAPAARAGLQCEGRELSILSGLYGVWSIYTIHSEKTLDICCPPSNV